MTPRTSILPGMVSLVLTLGGAASGGEVLYFTDFDTFPVGDNAWTGTDGWLSTDTTSGAQAIDDGLYFGSLGRTAALGFTQPVSTFTSVLRPINYDPGTEGTPHLEVASLLGIEDSTNDRRDSFFLSFYNMDGEPLASLRFSNAPIDFGIHRRSGNLAAGGTETDTGVEFVTGELYDVVVHIDLAANTWTAFLGNLPIFVEAPFNTTGLPRTLGPVAYEWQLNALTTAGFGDNWMLVADLRVETLDTPELRFNHIARDAGTTTLTWTTAPGAAYQVEYSDNGSAWSAGLPGSTFPNPIAFQALSFEDATGPGAPFRCYRLRRTDP